MPDNFHSFIYIHNDTFLNALCGKPKYDIFGLIKKFHGHIHTVENCILIDRTETFTYPVNTKSLCLVPPFEAKFNKNFKTLCEDAAKDILAEGKSVDIFWSGGVDSTTILVAFLTVCENKDQINVMFEKRTIH